MMMSDSYEKTTESLESLNNISCAGKVKCVGRSSGKKKAPTKDIELGSVDPDGGKDEDIKESIELISTQVNEDESSKPKKRFQRMSKGVILAKKFLSDEGENKEEKKELLKQRRMQHLGKFGKIKVDGSQQVLPSTSTSSVVDANPASRGRRESAAIVLFKAGVNKISAKPTRNAPTWQTYGGRSFLPTDWKYIEGDVVDGRPVDDFNFFGFNNTADIRDESGSDKIIRDESGSDKMVDIVEDVIVTETPQVLYSAATAINIADDNKSEKRGKSEINEKQRKKKKAWFLFANFLDRRIRRNVNEKLRNQFDDKREYFTVWLSFVQVVIMIVVLCIYPFAPIGKDVEVIQREVLLSREGVLYHENLKRKVTESFWLGPSLENLILLGAKYAPCMRRDNRVYAEIEKERKKENNTGCCMQTVSNGCIQRESKDCMTPSVEFQPKTVCGQDPRYCYSASISPANWDRNTIVSWPKCERIKKVTNSTGNRHMTCEVTGRPCCINTQGQCVITTQDNCKFWDGIYHPKSTLCSQVDCLSATCGNSFTNDDYPDQIYRLLLSLFLCAGILHLVIVLIFNFTILRDIEGYAGWFRTGLVFLLSGAGGNLWSAILLPYQAEVGESGAMFGIFACVFVEGIQNWNLLVKPWAYMGKLILILVVMLLFGLLPYIDNFAHIFGFVYGILLGFIILPTVSTKEDPEEVSKEKRKYLILSVISLILVFLLTLLGLILFYHTQDTQSGAIALFNCPLGEKFCQNYHQGQQIEQREIEY